MRWRANPLILLGVSYVWCWEEAVSFYNIVEEPVARSLVDQTDGNMQRKPMLRSAQYMFWRWFSLTVCTYKSSLRKCFKASGEVAVFFERQYKTSHLQIQVSPHTENFGHAALFMLCWVPHLSSKPVIGLVQLGRCSVCSRLSVA